MRIKKFKNRFDAILFCYGCKAYNSNRVAIVEHKEQESNTIVQEFFFPWWIEGLDNPNKLKKKYDRKKIKKIYESGV